MSYNYFESYGLEQEINKEKELISIINYSEKKGFIKGMFRIVKLKSDKDLNDLKDDEKKRTKENIELFDRMWAKYKIEDRTYLFRSTYDVANSFKKIKLLYIKTDSYRKKLDELKRYYFYGSNKSFNLKPLRIALVNNPKYLSEANVGYVRKDSPQYYGIGISIANMLDYIDFPSSILVNDTTDEELIKFFRVKNNDVLPVQTKQNKNGRSETVYYSPSTGFFGNLTSYLSGLINRG